MNAEMMYKVANIIEKIGDDHFDMGHWQLGDPVELIEHIERENSEHTHCGTACCVAGAALAVAQHDFGFKVRSIIPNELTLAWNDHMDKLLKAADVPHWRGGYEVFGQVLLGLTVEEASALFYTNREESFWTRKNYMTVDYKRMSARFMIMVEHQGYQPEYAMQTVHNDIASYSSLKASNAARGLRAIAGGWEDILPGGRS